MVSSKILDCVELIGPCCLIVKGFDRNMTYYFLLFWLMLTVIFSYIFGAFDVMLIYFWGNLFVSYFYVIFIPSVFESKESDLVFDKKKSSLFFFKVRIWWGK